MLGPHGILTETALLLENLNVSSQLSSDHYTNYINLHGRLPRDTPRLLKEIGVALQQDESGFRSVYVGTA